MSMTCGLSSFTRDHNMHTYNTMRKMMHVHLDDAVSNHPPKQPVAANDTLDTGDECEDQIDQSDIKKVRFNSSSFDGSNPGAF